LPRRIVIIGAHAAGVDAASAARKTDRTAEITLITDEKHAGYSRCGLPFVIGGQIPSFNNLIVFPPSYFQMMKLNLKTETKVTKIDTGKKVVATVDKAGKRRRSPTTA
jgi:NADH oxidase (H2O2-forming)